MSEPLVVSVRIRPDGGDGPPAVVPSRNGEAPYDDLATMDGQSFQRFDRIFGPTDTNWSVFMHFGAPMLDALLEDGYDCCLFAYGQTGSGKTHTMLGPDGGRGSNLDGVIPQTAQELFRRIGAQEADAAKAAGHQHRSQFQVRASYLEVWQGKAYDLLDGKGRVTVMSGEEKAFGEAALYSLGTAHPVTSAPGLLELIEQGSRNRTTASTGMNEHSSRSHAILTLTVEHRWVDVSVPPAAAAGGGGGGGGGRGGGEPTVRSRTNRLILVDLAGSESMEQAHGGRLDRSGTAINLGLMHLARVCAALASGANHVPYRNSTLTRLLKPALGGRCKTKMLACVSSNERQAGETLRTLQFGESVSGLRTAAAKVRARIAEPEDDPMAGDEDDSDALLRRRAAWIELPDFGDVFCRMAGNPRDPLLLYVHGSGPANSSMQWNWLVAQLAYRGSFYHVAIDCPGYGRSPGEKQTIRSYPASVLRSVVKSLGKDRAFCLLGSSQGACAVLNAVVDAPSLAYHVAVCHPVGHDVKRYTSIQQPTLLLFDEEDAGHPISVGRLMHKYLPTSHWFEWRESEHPGWLGENMATELLRQFGKHCDLAPRPDSSAARANNKKLPQLIRVAGGVRCWSRPFGREPAGYALTEEELAAAAAGSAASRSVRVSAALGDGSDAPAVAGGPSASAGATWVVRMDPATCRVSYFSPSTGETVKRRPRGAVITTDAALASGVPAAAAAAPVAGEDVGAVSHPLFESEEHIARLARREEVEAAEARAQELGQRDCAACGQPLLPEPAPERLKHCRHVICQCCAEETVRYVRNCPVCAAPAPSRRGRVTEVDAELARRLRAGSTSPSANEGQLAAQVARLQGLVRQRERSARIVLEVGNTAAVKGAPGEPLPAEGGGDGRVVQTTFCRVVGSIRKGSGCKLRLPAGCPVKRVDFNINPSYARPTARVTTMSADGFVLSRELSFTFPCFATVHWADAIGAAPLHLRYYTQKSERRRSIRLVVQLPAGGGGARRRSTKPPAPIDVDPAAGDGWVEYTASDSAQVRHFAADAARAIAPAARSSKARFAGVAPQR